MYGEALDGSPNRPWETEPFGDYIPSPRLRPLCKSVDLENVGLTIFYHPSEKYFWDQGAYVFYLAPLGSSVDGCLQLHEWRNQLRIGVEIMSFASDWYRRPLLLLVAGNGRIRIKRNGKKAELKFDCLDLPPSAVSRTVGWPSRYKASTQLLDGSYGRAWQNEPLGDYIPSPRLRPLCQSVDLVDVGLTIFYHPCEKYFWDQGSYLFYLAPLGSSVDDCLTTNEWRNQLMVVVDIMSFLGHWDHRSSLLLIPGNGSIRIKRNGRTAELNFISPDLRLSSIIMVGWS